MGLCETFDSAFRGARHHECDDIEPPEVGINLQPPATGTFPVSKSGHSPRPSHSCTIFILLPAQSTLTNRRTLYQPSSEVAWIATSTASSPLLEKLVQSVAAQVLGPGIVIFGDGPDGGREATFDGTVPFPSAAEPWTGYGIVQAKFLQRSHDVQTDTRWLTTQLESELKRLARRSIRWPDFYILATNVTLSSVSGTGGKDRVARILSRTRSSKKFRAWRVWDYDQLARFLDAYEGIRTAYGPWITSGDVLAAAMARLTSSRSDFDAVMTTFLAKELLHDQFANLDQAGHATEDKVPLAQVFVDLPVTSQRSSDPPRESPSTRPLGFANHVLQAAKDRWIHPQPRRVPGTSAPPPVLRQCSRMSAVPYCLVGLAKGKPRSVNSYVSCSESLCSRIAPRDA